MFSVVNVYRPIRTPDNEGGYTIEYGIATVIWAAVVIYDVQTRLQYREGEDIRPEDVLEIGSAWWRVVTRLGSVRAPYLEAVIERIERPIDVAD